MPVSMSGMRIWIARPEPGASRTAARVAGLGHAPLVAPVFTLAPTGSALPPGPFDGILLTSANAVLALAGTGLATGPDRIPVFAVGSRSAAAAREAGLRRVLDAQGDAAALAKLVIATLPAGARLLHPAGEERKAEPAASLAAAGYALTTHVAYAMRRVESLPDRVAAALDGSDGAALGAVLHYSRLGAEAALALAFSAGRGGAFRALTHYCLSRDVAAPLAAAGVVDHVIARRPSEDAILAALATGGRDTVSLRRGPGC